MSARLVYVVSEDWVFVSHRLSLAKQAIANGFDVIAITHIDKHEDILRSSGLKVINVNFSRSFKKPFSDVVSIYKLIKLFSQLKPDVIHNVGLKVSLISSIAASFSKVPVVINAYTGLGYVFSSSDKLAKMIVLFLNPALRYLNGRENTWAVFQNKDDRKIFENNNLINESKTILIKGSGVDANEFSFSGESEEPIIIMLASRMLWDKGVGEFVDASKLLKLKYPEVRFVLVGDIDEQNPMSLTKDIIDAWVDEGVVEWWGHKQTMSKTLKLAHVVVLPSYREGLPKVLLEAASVGRALIAADVPGCREIVRNEVNGYLVEVKNAACLAEAIKKLILNKELRMEMGKKGREIVEKELSSEIINEQFINLYQSSINSFQDGQSS
jgi:glycosyltransferase involved in cell wall biosynthesis